MILSRFSKGIKESAALSFGLSAKSLCDTSCRMLKEGFCYAESPERLYYNYNQKLIRHRRMLPENLINRASKEVAGLKWFRFSVSGSVPPKNKVKNWTTYSKGFRSLCEKLLNSGTKIHLPVESFSKARSDRSIRKGLPVVVRRTVQNKTQLKSTDHIAYVVGKTRGRHNLEECNRLAKELRSEKSVVICPAVFPNKFGQKSKCGKCTACASDKVDIILYPLH